MTNGRLVFGELLSRGSARILPLSEDTTALALLMLSSLLVLKESGGQYTGFWSGGHDSLLRKYSVGIESRDT